MLNFECWTMKDELEKYFLGELSDLEKKSLLDKIESDENLKSEFFRMQHTVALSKLHPQKGDARLALLMINELDGKLKQKQTHRIMQRVIKYAAVVALLVMNSWLLFHRESVPEEEISYTTIEVPKGQRISMTLPDGTEAWLSPRTIMRISNQFNKKNRLLELNGEGYFVVTKNKEKPFIVRTDQHDIKALGTRFNVFSYEESSRFETDLLDGQVEVSGLNYPKQCVLLNPGERVALENNQLVKSISRFNNEEYLKNGIFNFNNKAFVEILEYMSLWYDVEFDIKDSAKKELLISGKFRQSDEVKNILKALQGVHKFRYKEIDERRIEIY